MGLSKLNRVANDEYLSPLESHGLVPALDPNALSIGKSHQTDSISSRCKLLSDEARQKLLIDWNRTTRNWPDDPCLHELFEAQVSTSPTSIAIICGDEQLTYQQLDERARRVACQLLAVNVNNEEPVGFVADQSIEAIVALLGILKAGAAYLPLDHTFPTERINFYLQDANIRFVVGKPVAGWLEELHDVTVIPTIGLPPSDSVALPEISPERLAYVLFTSGSTGKPKGVMLNHRGPVNTVRDINERLAVTSSDRVLSLSSLGFDLSVYDLFGMFAKGATVVLPTAEESRNPECWSQLIQRHRVTIWNTVPALMEMLVTFLNNSVTLPSLKSVMLSGDWIPISLPDRIRVAALNANIFSLGGSTEASIWSVIHSIGNVDPQWRSIPYGEPLANQRCYVVDAQLNLCPIGEIGEFCIAGMGVAQGYLNRDQLTTDRFVPDPFVDGGILYRTGDLCRYGADGILEFLGRQDRQVKIHGYRIGIRGN